MFIEFALPTSGALILTPGMSDPICWKFRDVGIASSPSRVNTCRRAVVCTSTTGDCPETVIGLLQRTDPQLGVDRHVGVRRDLDPVALDGAESGEREGDGVGPRPEIDDRVTALTVGHRGADLLDECRTGRFNGDPGHDASRRVGDKPGDGALGCSGRRQNDQPDHTEQDQSENAVTHTTSLWRNEKTNEQVQAWRLPRRSKNPALCTRAPHVASAMRARPGDTTEPMLCRNGSDSSPQDPQINPQVQGQTGLLSEKHGANHTRDPMECIVEGKCLMASVLGLAAAGECLRKGGLLGGTSAGRHGDA